MLRETVYKMLNIKPHQFCSVCSGGTGSLVCPDCERDWKPVAGEKVMVEAEFVSDETDCWKLNIKTYRQPKHGIDIFVPLSSIRPMPKSAARIKALEDVVRELVEHGDKFDTSHPESWDRIKAKALELLNS